MKFITFSSYNHITKKTLQIATELLSKIEEEAMNAQEN
jgi:hypothetical protein